MEIKNKELIVICRQSVCLLQSLMVESLPDLKSNAIIKSAFLTNRSVFPNMVTFLIQLKNYFFLFSFDVNMELRVKKK